MQKALESAGYDPQTIEEVTADMKAAVQSVIQEHRESGEEGRPRDAVLAAIRETLGKHGIDPGDVADGVIGIDETV